MPHLVITGASAGIGAATAELFQNNGFDIVNLSRKPCTVAGVTNIRCDLSESDFIQAIQDDLYNALGDSARRQPLLPLEMRHEMRVMMPSVT